MERERQQQEGFAHSQGGDHGQNPGRGSEPADDQPFQRRANKCPEQQSRREPEQVRHPVAVHHYGEDGSRE